MSWSVEMFWLNVGLKYKKKRERNAPKEYSTEKENLFGAQTQSKQQAQNYKM